MTRLTYEDRFRRPARYLRRIQRAVVWRGKGALGKKRRILVEVMWRIGDEIMAISVYEALRAKYPSSHITVWCNYPDLLEENPFVDAVNDPDPEPDRYVLLREGPREAPRLEHYARLAGVPTPSARPRLHYEDWSSPVLDKVPAGPGPLVAVAPGASWATKRWPLEGWRALCEQLVAAGCRIVELGYRDEPLHVGTCLVDKTTVSEAACVLRAARVLICCDSGLMHLALAVGTPVLALFGPTAPFILGVENDPRFAVITNGRDCQGCWNRSRMVEEGVCPLKNPECLGTITPEHVFTRVQGLTGGDS